MLGHGVQVIEEAWVVPRPGQRGDLALRRPPARRPAASVVAFVVRGLSGVG